MKTVTEKYRAIKSGQITEAEFVRQMRLTHPEHITQFNGFTDTIQILKNKGLLFEEKEYVTVNLSDDSIRRGLRYELQAMNLDPAGKVTSEELDKAKQKATTNIQKDPLHYYNLLSGESSKVDKHDKEVEVKKGNHKDTHNGLKKADLKEEVIAEGTRALVGYLAGDRLTTAYNHYDGYPSHLGKALEMHYNNDEAAKDLALKGYISFMDADTGEVKSTHNDPPGKIKLSDDEEQMAREIGEEIDSMGADYGYIWDDRSNRWVTIKNTGIRSMIDQVIDKMGDYADVQEADLEETDVEEVIELPTLKETLGGIVAFLKSKGAGNDSIKDFIKMHKDDIQGMDMDSVEDEFNNFLSVNTDYVDETDAYDNDEETQDMIDKMRKDGKDSDDFIDEKKGKDHDKDGDIDGDDYMASKDKAIKKAMGKDKAVKENLKAIITKVLEEDQINEAATNVLAAFGDDYAGFDGMKSAINALENIVTDIEQYYDKTRNKIQKVYDTLGEIRNEEGLKVGGFLAPAVEQAFNRDLRPVIKQGFTKALDMPQVKKLAKPGMAQETEAPKQTVFGLNEKKK
jgi:hypothetical protein